MTWCNIRSGSRHELQRGVVYACDMVSDVQYATMSHDTRKFAKGHRSGKIPVWDISFSIERSRIVSGLAGHAIRFWNAENGEAVGQPLVYHTGTVVCVAMSTNGCRIVSGSTDRTVRV